MVRGRSVSFLLFFRVTRSAKSDNLSAFHGSSKPGNRSFGRFSRPLLEVYFTSCLRYKLKVKSLAVAEIFRYCKGFRLSYSYFCVLDQKYKRGAFEAIFTQKHRLVPKGKQTEWRAFKLSDFATRVTRKNGTNTDVPLTISAQYGLIDQRKFFSKTVASSDMSGYYLLHRGEFAYNRSTSNDYPLGSIKRLELHEMGAVSTLYLCFNVDENVIHPELAKWYFESSLWHHGIREICAEGARNHGLLNVPTDGFFATTHVLPPDREEQEKIAQYLGCIQQRCDKAEEELDLLLHLKNGMVQQLFI